MKDTTNPATLEIPVCRIVERGVLPSTLRNGQPASK
jgi:hypothetical protein